MFVVALVVGCSQECGGPSCASAWPASRLHVARRGDLLGRSPDLGDDVLTGSLVDGAAWSVAGAGPQILVGMPERGAVVLLAPPVGDVTVEEAEILRLERGDEAFGTSVAWGDTDGDGEAEIWVGAPEAEGGRGAVYRFSAQGGEPDLRLVGGSPSDGLGTRVQVCGDLTGDGRSDVVTTAPRFLAPDEAGWRDVDLPSLAGAVFVVADRQPGVDVPVWTRGPAFWGPERAASAGAGVACGADLTGDSLVDLAVGAPLVGGSGSVFVVPGGAGLVGGVLDPEGERVWSSDEPAARFGASLATASGLLLVGAHGADGGRGRAVRISTGAVDLELEGTSGMSAHLGRHLALGDLDGDGALDVWVGAPDHAVLDATNDARSRYDVGWAGVWTDVAGEPSVLPDLEVAGIDPFQRVGRATVLHDLDGDGRAEILQPVRAAEP